MPAHTHDGVDWAARLADLRQADAANATALQAVADRLIEAIPAPHPTVIDVGSGAGGMSAALAAALAGRAAHPTTAHPATIPNATTPTAAIPAAATSAAVPPIAVTPAVVTPAAATSTVGEGPVASRQPAIAVAGTGQSAAESATDHPATTPPAPADAALAANLNPDTVHQPAGTVAETGHFTATGPKPPTDSSVHDSNAVGARPVTAHPGAAASRPVHVTVHDSGSAVPASMAAHPGGATLVLVDVVPELLAAAEAAAVAAVGSSGAVDVRTVRADVADPASFVGLPSADLVWAANVVHHLPDQRAAVLMLAGLLAPGGCLALSEGGLSMRCLPWDVGVGEPGLQDRLIAAHGTWFHRMRADMPDSVRLPVGWNQVLSDAGLRGVTAFSYLVDVPAPLSEDGRGAVVSWLSWMSHAAADLLDPADMAALGRLLDPDDPAYVARRDDIFMLKASTVYLGWR